VSWDNPSNIVVVGKELLREMEEKMVNIKHNLKVGRDRQKSYADKEEHIGNSKWLIMCF
jgi:hypothetical protein